MCWSAHGADAVLPLWLIVVLVLSLTYVLGRYAPRMSGRRFCGTWFVFTGALSGFNAWSMGLYPDCYALPEIVGLSLLLAGPALVSAVSVWIVRARFSPSGQRSPLHGALREVGVAVVAICSPIGVVVVAASAF